MKNEIKHKIVSVYVCDLKEFEYVTSIISSIEWGTHTHAHTHTHTHTYIYIYIYI